MSATWVRGLWLGLALFGVLVLVTFPWDRADRSKEVRQEHSLRDAPLQEVAPRDRGQPAYGEELDGSLAEKETQARASTDPHRLTPCDALIAKARAAQAAGRLQEAEAIAIRAILQVRDAEESDSCMTERTELMKELAKALGEQSHAVELLEAVIRELRAGGDDHSMVLGLELLGLGNLLLEAERWSDVLRVFEDGISAFEQAEEAHMILLVLHLGLARAHGNLDDRPAAISALREARAAHDEAFPDATRAYPAGFMLGLVEGPLAMLLEETGKLEEAEQIHRLWLSANEDALRTDHPGLTPYVQELAAFYGRTGRHEEALAGYERALYLGKARKLAPFVQETHGGRGKALHALGREHEAWQSLTEWADVFEEGHVTLHPEADAETAELYARLLRERGRLQEAEEMEALATRLHARDSRLGF